MPTIKAKAKELKEGMILEGIESTISRLDFPFDEVAVTFESGDVLYFGNEEEVEVQQKLKLNLCQGCKDELKNHNPYIDSKGNTINIKDMEITIVPIAQCDNSNL